MMTLSAGQSVERLHELCVLGLISVGFAAVLVAPAAQAGAVPLLAVIAIIAAILFRGWHALRNRPVPISRRAVHIITVAYLIFFPLDHLYLSRDFVSATVHLMLFLAVVKLLTARTRRDFAFLKMLALLEMLAASLLSDSISFLIFLVLFLLFAVATLAAGEVRQAMGRRNVAIVGGHQPVTGRLLGLAGFASATILVLTAGLFFLLPRTARAAFSRMTPLASRYSVGYSGEVNLNKAGGRLESRDEPVLRVRLLYGRSLDNLKWRGNGLTVFDGRRWSGSGEYRRVMPALNGVVNLRQTPAQAGGQHLGYEVRSVANPSGTLFVAGNPYALQVWSSSVVQMWGGSLRASELPAQGGMAQYIVSTLVARNGQATFTDDLLLTPAERQANLLVPLPDARVLQLARAWTAGAPSDQERARRLEQHLRQDFRYTLDLPAQRSDDPLAHFLFERRAGHCEYFASSMAVMLRLLGVPARVVMGFQGGVHNPFSGWHVLRSSDAHAWVEAWLPGQGWTAFDPTPAAGQPQSRNGWAQMALMSDALDTIWQEWVVGYDLDQQVSLAVRADRSGRWLLAKVQGLDPGQWSWPRPTLPDGDTAARWSAGLIALAVVSFAGWYWHGHRRLAKMRQAPPTEQAAVLYAGLLQTLERRGVRKPDWQTPHEFAASVEHPVLRLHLTEATAAYEAARFGRQADSVAVLAAKVAEVRNVRT